MSVSQSFIKSIIAGDTDWRAWGSWLSAMFTSMGWAKTADTGQVDWTTITRPAANTTRDYEIRKSSVGSPDIYIRLDYMLTTSDAFPNFKITVGTGSNGSGTITGTFIIPATGMINNSLNGDNAYFDCRFVWNGSSFAFIMNRDSNGGNTLPWLFCLERTRDSSGAEDSRGVTLYTCQASAVGAGRRFQQSIVFGVGLTAQTSEWCMKNPIVSSSMLGGVGPAAYAIRPCLPAPDNPSLLMMAMRQADFPEGGLITYNWYGANRTYLSTKNGNLGRVSQNGDTAGGLLLLYE